jgi:hypothetical protein
MPSQAPLANKDWNPSVWSLLCPVVGVILLCASPALLITMVPVLIGGSCVAQTENNSAAAPTPSMRAHMLTAKRVAEAKRNFAKMVNTLSSTSKDGQAGESGRLDAEALANLAKQYEYSTEWWWSWFIEAYTDEENLAKKIALRRYGSDETKADPYVDSFVEHYKTIMDDGSSQYTDQAHQEFEKLKFFMNQPVNVWIKYYGPSVSKGHWHRWKTDHFDLTARTHAGNVEYVSVKDLSDRRRDFSLDQVKALGESLGLKVTLNKEGWYDGENDQLFLETSREGLIVGTAESRKRNLLDWDDLKDLDALGE